jgi:hypothetical protein
MCTHYTLTCVTITPHTTYTTHYVHYTLRTLHTTYTTHHTHLAELGGGVFPLAARHRALVRLVAPPGHGFDLCQALLGGDASHYLPGVSE